MPHTIPTEQEWEAAKKACDDARAAVRDKWYNLSAEQQKRINEMEFEYDRVGEIDKDAPQEKELTDEAIAALNSAENDYNELLTELDNCIAEL